MPEYFTITKISTQGTSNPIIARLYFQIVDLFKLVKLPKEGQKEIHEKLHELCQELLACYDTYQKLVDEFNKEIEKIKPFDPLARMYHNPYMEHLKPLSENFLRQTKKYLVILGKFLELFYPDLDTSKKTFWAMGKNNIFDNFLYLKRPDLKNVFEGDSIWLNELISKRNSVEHPGGYSGNLQIVNFQTMQMQKIFPPVWYRTKDKETLCVATDIIQDIEMWLTNLLTFSEDIIIHFCIENNFCIKQCVLYEIPEGKRNKNCPVRFKVTISKIG